MTGDRVFEAFLTKQYEDGMALAAASDLVAIEPLGEAADRYLLRFSCKGLVRALGGEITEATRFEVGIWFPPDYLRRAVPWEVLTWLGPRRVLHPNVSDRGPFICVGRLSPGTSLVDLAFQCYEIITYQKVTMREDDALNPWACVWARDNQHRFPIDRRPLKRAVRAVA